MTATVTVVGSVNLDVIVRVERLPGAGETLLARSRSVGLGGKGANQAIAAARAGATSRLVGAVGDDDAGGRVRRELAAIGVDVAALGTVAGASSGTAFVFVDDAGENLIVVDQGANDLVDLDESALDVVRAADVLVVQNEVSVEVVSAAVSAAEEAGTRVVVNLAPYRAAPDVVAVADPLVVNEHEASELLGEPVADPDDVRRLAGRLLALCRSAVVTLGADGAVLVTADEVVQVDSPSPHRVVDTTGAGDAFVGVLAAGLATGLSLPDCAVAAAAAGSLSVESAGAGSGYPRFDLPRG
ncbi:MAG: ribokinase [Aeromicrobium sp.]